MNPDRLGVAVIGVGHLGSRHAARLQASPAFHLTSIYDRDPERARREAERWETRAARSLEEAVLGAQAVVVATSTASHYDVTRVSLRAGRPALVEKPLTGKVEEALDLVTLARSAKVVLHVGHVERFNPALRDLLGHVERPLFVESHRLAPFIPRNLDLDVVQDLMVHDLDLTLAFVGEEPSVVDAVGVSVLSERIDIASARLRFPSGTVANLTASRVSRERVRKFRMFLPGTYVSADCATGTGTVARVRPESRGLLRDALRAGVSIEMENFLELRQEASQGADALTLEHEAFRKAILGQPSQGVTGEAAVKTLRAMVRVEEALNAAQSRDG